MSARSSLYETCSSSSESEDFHSVGSSLSLGISHHIYANVVVADAIELQSIGSIEPDGQLAEIAAAECFNIKGCTVDDPDAIEMEPSISIELGSASNFLKKISPNRYRVRYSMPDADREDAATGEPLYPRPNPIFPDKCSLIFAIFCFLSIFSIFVYYVLVLSIK